MCLDTSDHLPKTEGFAGIDETSNNDRSRLQTVLYPISWTALGLVIVGAVVSCTAQPTADTCAVDVPTGCPDPTLTYESGLGAKLQTGCSPCHAPGGVESTVPLMDYGQVSKRLTSIAGQLQTCTMPPAGAAPLSPSDRQAIIDWIVCGAPPR